MKSPRIGWLVRKDLKECLGNRMVLLPMILLPLILCVAMPAIMIVAALGGGDNLNAKSVEKLLPFYDIPAAFAGEAERLLYVLLNYILMPLFLIIPMMVSVIIAAHSVAGEKERQSLETLLYTPITNEEFVLGKLLSAFIPAFVVSLGSFALYFITANSIYFALRGAFIVSAPAWIPAILLIDPAACLLGLGAAFLVSLKAKTSIEAQQVAAMVVLPCVLLIGGQLGGILVLSPLGITLFGVLLLAADYLLIAKIGPRFERERVLSSL